MAQVESSHDPLYRDTSPLCSTPVTVQLIIIDLLHSLFIVLEVLVIILTLRVFALLTVIRRLQELSL